MAIAMTGLLIEPSWAYLWSAFIGATTAIIFTLGMAAPAEMVASDQVGRASGLLLSIGYLGAVLGPLGYGILESKTATPAFGYLIALCLSIGVVSFAIPKVQHYQSCPAPLNGSMLP